MKRFQFRYHSILKQRELLERRAATEMSKCKLHFQNLLEQKRDLLDRKQLALVRRDKISSETTNIQDFQIENEFISGTEHRLQNLDIQITKARKKFEKALTIFFEKTKEKKIFEKLKDKDKAKFQARLKKSEKKILDDLYNSHQNVLSPLGDKA